MHITLRVLAAAGTPGTPGRDATILAAASDIVSDLAFGGDHGGRQVKLFRSPVVLRRPGGHASETISLRIEREHRTLSLALRHLAERRKYYRALATPGTAPLSIELRFEYDAPVVLRLDHADITPGPSSHAGLRTFETLTLAGILS